MKRGFTLIELFLSLAILTGSLVFIVGALANLSSRLSRSETQIEALSLASGKVLEWQETLRYGGRPYDLPASGSFEGHPGYEWRAEVAQSPLEESLYDLRFEVSRRVRGTPTFTLRAEGRRREGQVLP